MTDIRKAYAALGLRAGVSLSEVRRRYRALVLRWHPDRYANDVHNQKEAGEQMRRFNGAYRTLTGHLEVRRPASPTGPRRPSASPPRARLSRDEIEGLIRAIRPEGPVSRLLWFLSVPPGAARRFLW